MSNTDIQSKLVSIPNGDLAAPSEILVLSYLLPMPDVFGWAAKLRCSVITLLLTQVWYAWADKARSSEQSGAGG